jgi:glucuronate isomerase
MEDANKSKPLIHDDFLLQSSFAKALYHEYAENMPIIDYHNHLSAENLARDLNFENITQAWLHGDHYKYRALRANGVNEKYITGNASDEEKFAQWAQTIPQTLRNPLYHWNHLELARYFEIYDSLTPANAQSIFEETSNKLQTVPFSCRGLISKMRVEVLCTTEDPTDSLEHHKKLASSDFATKVSTAFRPDKALAIKAATFNAYVDTLASISDTDLTTYNKLCDALENRMHYFHEHGCRLSDHGLPHMYALDFTAKEVASIYEKARTGKEVSDIEAQKFQSALLLFCSKQYHKLGWVQQFHLGAQRNNNSRMFKKLGPDTGWDSIGDYPQAQSLSRFLDKLDTTDSLTKTILYNLNPKDNAVFAAMVGNFNDGSIKGKVQWGSAWWFLDQKDGMEAQINVLSSLGSLSSFVGMLTDSRSFLSFPRHEYFRRILCNLLGNDIQNGELPNDIDWIGNMVKDICYRNAKDYFDF